MGDWDRIALILIGGLTGIYTGYLGRGFWRQRQWLPLGGVALLIGMAVGLPILLMLWAT